MPMYLCGEFHVPRNDSNADGACVVRPCSVWSRSRCCNIPIWRPVVETSVPSMGMTKTRNVMGEKLQRHHPVPLRSLTVTLTQLPHSRAFWSTRFSTGYPSVFQWRGESRGVKSGSWRRHERVVQEEIKMVMRMMMKMRYTDTDVTPPFRV